MKFLSVLAVSIGAVSAQLDVVSGVLNQASTQIGALNTAVNGFSGDPGPLTAANDQLLTILRDGTTTVTNSAPLSQADALQLPGPVTALNSSVAQAVDLLISKQQAFSQACVIQTVLTALQDQKTAASALAAAITTKVPDELGLKEIAAQLSGAIAANLDRGISVFSSATNAPTCSGSSTAAPPPGSSTPAPPPGSSTPVPPPGSSTSAPPPGSSTNAPPPGSSTPAPPPGSSTSAPPPGSSTGAPPPPPGSSSGSPPPLPSNTYPTGKPTHPPHPSPSPSKPSPPGTPPTKPDTPPTVPDTPPTVPGTPPSVPTRRPTVPTTPSATATRAPPAVFPGAAPVNQVGASLAFVAGLAALLV